MRALDGCPAVVHLAQVGAERGGYTYEAHQRRPDRARPRGRAPRGRAACRLLLRPRRRELRPPRALLEPVLPLQARRRDDPVPLRRRGRRVPALVRGGPRRHVRADGRRRARGGRGREARRRLVPHAADRGVRRRRARPRRGHAARGCLPDGVRPRRARGGRATRSSRAAWPRPRAPARRRPACACARCRWRRRSGARGRRLPGAAAGRARLPAVRRGLRFPRPLPRSSAGRSPSLDEALRGGRAGGRGPRFEAPGHP